MYDFACSKRTIHQALADFPDVLTERNQLHDKVTELQSSQETLNSVVLQLGGMVQATSEFASDQTITKSPATAILARHTNSVVNATSEALRTELLNAEVDSEAIRRLDLLRKDVERDRDSREHAKSPAHA